MFIKNMMETAMVYRKSNVVVELKPNSVTFVDETLVSLKELKDCYGDRIYAISPEVLGETDTSTETDENNNEVINNQSIDNNDDEGNNDITADEADTINLELEKKLAKAQEALEAILNGDDEIKKGFVTDIQAEALKFNHTVDAMYVMEEFNKRYTEYTEAQEALKGNEDVENFLEGKTDELPKDTQEITEDEAKKVKENTGKAKEAKPKATAKTNKAKTNKTTGTKNASKK